MSAAKTEREQQLRAAISRGIEQWHKLTFSSHFQAIEQLRDLVEAEVLPVLKKQDESHKATVNGLLDTITEKQNQLTALIGGQGGVR